MSDVTAIVITYFPSEKTVENIRLLEKTCAHIVIVDNSACTGAHALLQKNFSAVPGKYTLSFNPKNIGVAAALNIGLRISLGKGSEWTLTMDQDSRIAPEMVDKMMKAYRSCTPQICHKIASLAPSLRDFTDSDNFSGDPKHTTAEAFRFVPTAITSGNLIKTSAWNDIGGFNESLFIDYVDHDFCFRLRKAGYLILECQNAVLFHSIGNANVIKRFGRLLNINQHPPLRLYYILRNGLFFWSRHQDCDGFIKSDKLNTFKIIIKALLFDSNKIQRLRMLWAGYCDFRNNRFGCYSDHNRS